MIKAFVKSISKPFIYENKKLKNDKAKSKTIIFFLPKLIKSNKKAIQAKIAAKIKILSSKKYAIFVNKKDKNIKIPEILFINFYSF